MTGLFAAVQELLLAQSVALNPVLLGSAYRGQSRHPCGGAVMPAFVELRGGISPPRAPRHVREPLDLYGSRCSAVAMT